MSALAFLVACIVFVLAALGVVVGDLGTARLIALGLAFVAAGLLLPGAVAYFGARRA